MKIGLKLWSSNDYYIPIAKMLYQNNKFDYIELFIEPKTDSFIILKWRELQIPFIFHAPHSYTGFNLADPLHKTQNFLKLTQIHDHLKVLNPRSIIFHSGSNGTLAETLKQLALFKNEFGDIFSISFIENKPAVGLKGEPLIGSRPDEIISIMQEFNFGFCLDIGHAISAAAYYNKNPINYINNFLKLRPSIFHLSDGHEKSFQDEHLHLGYGDYNFNEIFSLLKDFSSNYITIETKKDSKNDLIDFEQDVAFLRSLPNAID